MAPSARWRCSGTARWRRHLGKGEGLLACFAAAREGEGDRIRGEGGGEHLLDGGRFLPDVPRRAVILPVSFPLPRWKKWPTWQNVHDARVRDGFSSARFWQGFRFCLPAVVLVFTLCVSC